MPWLGHACGTCGWSLSQMNDEDTIRQCDLCGRTEINDYGFWYTSYGGTKLQPEELVKLCIDGLLTKNDVLKLMEYGMFDINKYKKELDNILV